MQHAPCLRSCSEGLIPAPHVFTLLLAAKGTVYGTASVCMQTFGYILTFSSRFAYVLWQQMIKQASPCIYFIHL